MAKGAIGKENLINKFIKDNPNSYIGCYDKKYYFWADENGEKIQIAVSMTCPKVPVETASVVAGGDLNFEDNAPKGAMATSFEPQKEISEEEQDNISKMMKELGLI